MEHQTDNSQHIERTNNNDNFEIFKLKIIMIIDKVKGKRKRAVIDAIHNFIVQADATNIDKNTMKDNSTSCTETSDKEKHIPR